MLLHLLCLFIDRVSGLSLRETIQFDREAYVYDPRGRVLQLEYAERAADNGGLIFSTVVQDVGIICAFIYRNETKKIFQVDDGNFIAYTGLRSDGASLLDRGRRAAASERLSFPEERPLPKRIARTLADTMHAAARGGGNRAYGVHLLIAGLSQQERPELFTVHPGGNIHCSHHHVLGGSGQSKNSKISSLLSSSMEGDCTTPEQVIASLTKMAFCDYDAVITVQVLAFRRDRNQKKHKLSSPRVFAWLADLRRDDLTHDLNNLHPRALASLTAALSDDDDAAQADAALSDISASKAAV